MTGLPIMVMQNHHRILMLLCAVVCTLSLGSLVQAAPKKLPFCKDYFQTNNTYGDYKPLEDGLVLDQASDLIWYRCHAGESWQGEQCVGSGLLLPFIEAQQYAAAAKVAGFDDWRVPKIKEMESLLEEACISPAVNVLIFQTLQVLSYWSSSTNFWSNSSARSLYFYKGVYSNRQHRKRPLPFLLVRDKPD